MRTEFGAKPEGKRTRRIQAVSAALLLLAGLLLRLLWPAGRQRLAAFLDRNNTLSRAVAAFCEEQAPLYDAVAAAVTDD